jgi:hypothetical protein
MMFEHRLDDETRHGKIGLDNGLRIGADALPDGINDFDTSGGARNMAHG